MADLFRPDKLLGFWGQNGPGPKWAQGGPTNKQQTTTGGAGGPGPGPGTGPGPGPGTGPGPGPGPDQGQDHPGVQKDKRNCFFCFF